MIDALTAPTIMPWCVPILCYWLGMAVASILWSRSK